MHRKLLRVLLPVFGIGLQCFSQGNLLLTPMRVVFEGNKQKEKIYLVNTGKDTATYSVSFLNYRQTEDGRYTIIEKPDSGQMFADPYLRFYPRTVSLAPGETQSVMIYTRRKTDMPAGEYRSHLYFRSEKDYAPIGTKSKDTLKTVRVQLIPIFGISIPVLMRTGAVDVSISLSDLQLDKSNDSILNLKLVINRTGNISVNGDLAVDYIPVKGKSYEIGRLKSIAVYTDNRKRLISIKLNITPGMELTGGMLKVRYTSAEDAKKQDVYSEAELKL
jgi:hypothetical protein